MEETALVSALWVAALALTGNLVYAIWNRWQDKRGLAGALAGEIGAYTMLLTPAATANGLRALAVMDEDTRRQRLRMFGTLPDPHPVFDKVADKLALLPGEDAREVSAFYNWVTGMRLMQIRFGSDAFIGQPNNIQVQLLAFIADDLERRMPMWQALEARLRRRARIFAWSS